MKKDKRYTLPCGCKVVVWKCVDTGKQFYASVGWCGNNVCCNYRNREHKG
jgi:hypothetical protein